MKLIKFKNNLLLGAIIFIVLFAFNIIVNYKNIVEVFNFDSIIIVFLISLLGTFSGNKRNIIIFFSFIFLLITVESLHIAYYGNVLFAIEIWLFFTQFNEIISGIGVDTFVLFYKAILSLIVSLIIVLARVKFVKPRIEGSKYVLYAFFGVILLFWPLSIFLQEGSIGQRPSSQQHILRSALETTSGFLGNTLPNKLFSNKQFNGKITPTPKPIKTVDANIVLVIGESLAPKHMSVYGYQKETTPLLKQLVVKNILTRRLAVAGGTSTEGSLSAFFNVLDSIAGESQIISQNTSLFKLAKNNNFNTYFFSAQATYALGTIKNVIGSKYIDMFKSASNIDKSLSINDGIFDEKVIGELDNIDFNSNNFIVIQELSSHEAYIDRYPKKFDIFKPDDYKYAKTAYYDNSVRYTDFYLDTLLSVIQNKSKKPTYFIFTSDHGESVGEGGVFGHLMRRHQVIEVPLLLAQFNTDNSIDFDTIPQIVRHNYVSRLVANLLGYNFSLIKKNKSYVNGFVLNGSAGYAEVFYNDSVITKIVSK